MSYFTQRSLLNLSLSDEEIHVWRVALDSLTPSISKFYNILSIDEKIRSARYRFARDKNHFIIRRGILRKILAYYLGKEPNQLHFSYQKNSKPTLKNIFNKANFYFNLSHSAGIALFAFAYSCEIGVDIERIRNICEMDQIAESFFTERENTVLSSLSRSNKRVAFFNCWTRKEAFTKAIGDGLSFPLSKFEVSLAPDEPARLLAIDGSSKKASHWSIVELKPASGFAAALAIKGKNWRLHCLELPT